MAYPGDLPRGDGSDGPSPEDLLGSLDGRPGPARRISSAVSAEMVRSVLEAALDTPVDELDELPPPPAPRAPRWRRPLLLAAAAVVALSVGTAASAVALRFFDIKLGSAELTETARRAPRERPVPPPRPPAAEVVAPPPAAEPPADVEIEIPRSAVEPEPEPARPSRRKKAPRVAVKVVPWQEPPAPPEPAAPPAVVPENLPPADLLAAANEWRKKREWEAADMFYRAVTTRFPATDAAVVAEVASAALHLQHLADARGALAAYHRTLEARPTGPLAEEARWGIVEARRAMHDGPAEAEALRDFLAHHLDSALAPAAQRRLDRLTR